MHVALPVPVGTQIKLLFEWGLGSPSLGNSLDVVEQKKALGDGRD